MLEEVRQAVEFIGKRVDFQPEYGIILGTGLGGLTAEMAVEQELLYANIPGFPIATVEFHTGKLLFGVLGGKKVVAMQGRLHYYEGYSMQQVTFPVRVMKMLGIKKMFVSNACGALNPDYRVGDLMIISDHINLQPDSPLRGRYRSEFGPRFPDMTRAYDREMLETAVSIALENNIRAHTGVYVSVAGPQLETRAEYRFLRIIGGDAVGMSTVPEVIAARQTGLPVFAVSVITDLGYPEDPEPTSVESILAAAREAEPKMTLILKELITRQ